MKPLALLFLLLPGCGWAAPAVRNSGGPARAPIRPLLLGALSDPDGPLTRSLDRIFAGVLIRVMAEPGMTRDAAATLAPAFPALGSLLAVAKALGG